jgi:hypothetical protein
MENGKKKEVIAKALALGGIFLGLYMLNRILGEERGVVDYRGKVHTIKRGFLESIFEL